MRAHPRKISFSSLSILVACVLIQQALGASEKETCSLEELNHSILVECGKCQSTAKTSGTKSSESIWPAKSGEILHIKSSRAGDRFSRNQLQSLNSQVSAYTRLLDINTTLSVRSEASSSQLARPEIDGLGGTLDVASLASAIQSHSFERNYAFIFDDLFGTSNSSARLALVRLHMDASLVSEDGLTNVLLEINDRAARLRAAAPKLKVLIHLKGGSGELLKWGRLLSSLNHRLNNLILWGFALGHEELSKIEDWRHAMPPNLDLYASLLMSQVPNFLRNLKERAAPRVEGLLMQSERAVPYDVLDLLADSGLKLLSIGRPRAQTEILGDWSNAHEHAIEIMNHLKHGASGFFEEQTVIDLESSSGAASSDGSIYSLASGRQVHFKGPMFYATGHFSRYLADSRAVDYELFTQPNMFSAHYSAFTTADREHIISVVLNGNEHKQPFSWNLGDTIVANTLLDSKSLNTFIIKV